MNKIIVNNWVKNLLAPAMKENGCPFEIRTAEDVISNLYYLSKEDSRGSRYIPLQYKRMIEKIIFGLFNSAFEYNDKEDVYFEKIGETIVCSANVRFVVYEEDGSKKVLGHGFHSLSLGEVMPGVFMSDMERASKWKSTVIGGAKSRALYDAGIGLEFYGDIFAPEINLDEHEVETKPVRSKEAVKPKEVYTADGLPIPQPKRGRPKKEEKALDVIQKDDSKKEAPEMSLEVAKALSADCGNYTGMSLGEIYETAPKNLVFLMNNSGKEDIKKAATLIISKDQDLSERFL